MLQAGTKVRVLRGTWAGQEGVVQETDGNYRTAMVMIKGAEVKLADGTVVQLPENNLECI